MIEKILLPSRRLQVTKQSNSSQYKQRQVKSRIVFEIDELRYSRIQPIYLQKSRSIFHTDGGKFSPFLDHCSPSDGISCDSCTCGASASQTCADGTSRIGFSPLNGIIVIDSCPPDITLVKRMRIFFFGSLFSWKDSDGSGWSK